MQRYAQRVLAGVAPSSAAVPPLVSPGRLGDNDSHGLDSGTTRFDAPNTKLVESQVVDGLVAAMQQAGRTHGLPASSIRFGAGQMSSGWFFFLEKACCLHYYVFFLQILTKVTLASAALCLPPLLLVVHRLTRFHVEVLASASLTAWTH